MIGFFTRKQAAPVIPLPPVDPPPDASRRKEKELAWLQTIRSSTRKGSSTGREIRPKKGIEHIAVIADGGHGGGAKGSGLTLNRKKSSRTRQPASEEQLHSNVSLHSKSHSPLRSGLASLRSHPTVHTKAPAVARADDPSKPTPSYQQPTLLSPLSDSFVHVAPVSTSNKSAPSSSSTLAQRLQELEHANSAGLLDDQEYRVLKLNLFERATNPENTDAATEEGSLSTSHTRREPVANTGELLQLPRLQTGVSGAAPPPLSDQRDTQSSLLPLPSASTHGHSASSFRSGRSSASNRFSSLFRRHASTPAPASAYDTESLASFPVTLKSSRSLKAGRAIPKDWRALQETHAKAQREERLRGAGDVEVMRIVSPPRARESTSRERSRTRTLSGNRSDPALGRSGSTPTTQSAPPVIPSTPPKPQRTASLIRRARSDSRLTVTSSSSPTSSELIHSTASESSTASHHTFRVVQPGDALLSSSELQTAIAAAAAEKQRLSKQFEELEQKLQERVRGDARTSGTSRRDGGALVQDDSARRNSLAISMLSNPAAGQSHTDRLSSSLSAGNSHGHPRVERRPSLLGSTSRASSSSSSKHASRPSPAGRLSSIASSEDDEELSFLPSKASSTSAFDPASGTHNDMEGLDARAASGSKELDELRQRRSQVEGRYQARIEYLEASLKSAVRREKLRR